MSKGFERLHVCYADFEASTDGEFHKAYCVCFNLDGIDSYYYGHNCAILFLKAMPTNTLIYFHNLSYDITFLMNHFAAIVSNPIIKNGRTYSLMAKFKDDNSQYKTLLFKDSYAIIPHPLRKFPIMFGLDSGRKEVFPYNYYSSARSNQMYGNINEALEYIKEEDRYSFISNVNEFAKGNNPNEFNMRDYAVFYCMQDVNILCKGFEWFRSSLLSEFGLDTYDFVSISSIANRYMEINCYWLNQNLYDLANTPREFISRCITGGRCMIRDNTKCKSDRDIVDFDAVSLYPSAMARLYCLEGVPKVIPNECLSSSFLLSHLFDEEQLEPTTTRFISGFFVEVSIECIKKPRHFPLIVYNPEYNNNSKDDDYERSCNRCCKMYIDHITYKDLIDYQGCIIRPIRGYYYDGKRDIRIREVIRTLFELRLKYKKEGNPLQEVIKLILNSIYGKTILKPIDTQYKFIRKNDLEKYINNRYNYIQEITKENTSRTFCLAKELKAYNKHFTFVTLGVNILSMSKRIMNEVISTAEDINIIPYYQDTDSIHIHKDQLEPLANEYKKRYGRDLVGKDLGQFHCDFASFGDSNTMPIAIRSIFCGKKTYIDMLQNDLGQIAFHCRSKGIIPDVIVQKANELFPNSKQCEYRDGLVYPTYDTQRADEDYSIMLLYQKLYNGDAIEFDLCNSKLKPCFEVSSFEVSTKESFIRRLQF